MFQLICAIIVIVFYMDQEIQAVTFNREQLREQLRSHGFPEDQLNDWICLVEAESSGNTAAVGPVDPDGSRDYGLFQINSKYWCSDSDRPGNGCDVTCAEVSTDDISKASECAKKVYSAQGFEAWTGWREHCRH